jgi:hypothetical protein
MSVTLSIAYIQHIIGDVSLGGTISATETYEKVLRTPSYP